MPIPHGQRRVIWGSNTLEPVRVLFLHILPQATYPEEPKGTDAALDFVDPQPLELSINKRAVPCRVGKRKSILFFVTFFPVSKQEDSSVLYQMGCKLIFSKNSMKKNLSSATMKGWQRR